jgi:hypothetical protein
MSYSYESRVFELRVLEFSVLSDNCEEKPSTVQISLGYSKINKLSI